MWDRRRAEPGQAANRNATHTHRHSHTRMARLTDTLRDANPQHKTPRPARPRLHNPHTQPDPKEHPLSNTNTIHHTETQAETHPVTPHTCTKRTEHQESPAPNLNAQSAPRNTRGTLALRHPHDPDDAENRREGSLRQEH